MRTHRLKTWPGPFAAILSGVKRYEIRENDRGFSVGDTLQLVEYDQTRRCETGRELSVMVLYMSPGGTWGLPSNLCVMSIEKVSP